MMSARRYTRLATAALVALSLAYPAPASAGADEPGIGGLPVLDDADDLAAFVEVEDVVDIEVRQHRDAIS